MTPRDDPRPSSDGSATSQSSPERRGRLGEAWTILRQAAHDWRDDDALAWGAAVAFYAILSLAPLLLVSLALAGAVWDDADLESQIVGQMQALIGDSGAELVETVLDSAEQTDSKGLAASLGIVAILFAASGVFAQLQKALNRMWEVAPAPDLGLAGLVRARLVASGLVLAVGFLLLVSLVVSAVLSGLSSFAEDLLPAGGALAVPLNVLTSLALATGLFALIFKVLPDVEIEWRDVGVGAFVTAILFTIGKVLIGLYLGRSSVGSAYGAAGSLVVVLVWVYYSSQILFFGAELTQVWARRHGSRIRPSDHAVPLVEADRRRGRASEAAR